MKKVLFALALTIVSSSAFAGYNVTCTNVESGKSVTFKNCRSAQDDIRVICLQNYASGSMTTSIVPNAKSTYNVARTVTEFDKFGFAEYKSLAPATNASCTFNVK